MSNLPGKPILSNTNLDATTLTSMQQVLVSQGMNVFKTDARATDRPFECTMCGNRFRQQCHLTQHIRIHTNDRPYHCSHCEKAFKQKSQLNQHERIHTGEKPYQCPLCAKAFPQAGQLYSHKKTHGINPRVTKDPPDGDVPRRGRKRKNNAPMILSPPPVAYLIETMHRPLSQYQSHSVTEESPKGTVSNYASGHEVSPVSIRIDKHIQDQLLSTVNTIDTLYPNVSSTGRPRIIPVSHDQYQYFLQNHMLQQGHQSSSNNQKTTSRNSQQSSVTKNKKKVDNSSVIATSKSHLALEGVPAHLKDLERLIPTCDT